MRLYVRVIELEESCENGHICRMVLGLEENAVEKLDDAVKTGVLPDGLSSRGWMAAGGAGATSGELVMA